MISTSLYYRRKKTSPIHLVRTICLKLIILIETYEKFHICYSCNNKTPIYFIIETYESWDNSSYNNKFNYTIWKNWVHCSWNKNMKFKYTGIFIQKKQILSCMKMVFIFFNYCYQYFEKIIELLFKLITNIQFSIVLECKSITKDEIQYTIQLSDY